MKEILYAPWRTDYISGKKIEGCVFCYIGKHAQEDEALHVLHRDEPLPLYAGAFYDYSSSAHGQP